MAQVKNLEISIPTEQFSTTVHTDSMNQTHIWINDVECEPDEDGAVYIPAVTPGDLIQLETRSSGWYGNVVSVGNEVVIAVEAGGHFESIRAGLSGLVTWNIRNAEYATVQSSLHSDPVRWDIYVHTKAAANCAASELSNEGRNEVWSELLAVCARTAVVKPAPDWWGRPDTALDEGTLRVSAEVEEILGAATFARLGINIEVEG